MKLQKMPRGRKRKERTQPIKPVCQQCQKEFSNQSALTKHKLTHSDERRHACNQCSKAFKRQDHLTGHMQTHCQRKPFYCNIQGCDKTYCDARSLRRHMENIHHIQTPKENLSRQQQQLNKQQLLDKNNNNSSASSSSNGLISPQDLIPQPQLPQQQQHLQNHQQYQTSNTMIVITDNNNNDINGTTNHHTNNTTNGYSQLEQSSNTTDTSYATAPHYNTTNNLNNHHQQQNHHHHHQHHNHQQSYSADYHVSHNQQYFSFEFNNNSISSSNNHSTNSSISHIADGTTITGNPQQRMCSASDGSLHPLTPTTDGTTVSTLMSPQIQYGMTSIDEQSAVSYHEPQPQQPVFLPPNQFNSHQTGTDFQPSSLLERRFQRKQSDIYQSTNGDHHTGQLANQPRPLPTLPPPVNTYNHHLMGGAIMNDGVPPCTSCPYESINYHQDQPATSYSAGYDTSQHHHQHQQPYSADYHVTQNQPQQYFSFEC